MRRPVTAVAAVLSVVVLSGCATGLQAQTYKARTAGSTSSGEVDGLALRGFAIDVDPTAAPRLTGIIVNHGTASDQLVSAATPAATGVQFLSASGAPVLELPAGHTSGTDWALQFDGLAAPLVPGTFVEVTLQFAKAGRTTLSVPVRAQDNGLGDRTPARDPYHEG